MMWAIDTKNQAYVPYDSSNPDLIPVTEQNADSLARQQIAAHDTRTAQRKLQSVVTGQTRVTETPKSVVTPASPAVEGEDDWRDTIHRYTGIYIYKFGEGTQRLGKYAVLEDKAKAEALAHKQEAQGFCDLRDVPLAIGGALFGCAGVDSNDRSPCSASVKSSEYKKHAHKGCDTRYEATATQSDWVSVVVWKDSCGAQQEEIEVCKNDAACLDGVCLPCTASTGTECRTETDGHNKTASSIWTVSVCENWGTKIKDCSPRETCENEAVECQPCTSHDHISCEASNRGNAVYYWDSCGYQDGVYQQCTETQKCTNNVGKQDTCEDCTSHATRNCSDGDVYYFDSCGRKQEEADDCSSSEVCVGSACVTDCDSSHTYRCFNGDVYKFDACGNNVGLSDDCASNEECSDAICGPLPIRCSSSETTGYIPNCPGDSGLTCIRNCTRDSDCHTIGKMCDESRHVCENFDGWMDDNCRHP